MPRYIITTGLGIDHKKYKRQVNHTYKNKVFVI